MFQSAQRQNQLLQILDFSELYVKCRSYSFKFNCTNTKPPLKMVEGKWTKFLTRAASVRITSRFPVLLTEMVSLILSPSTHKLQGNTVRQWRTQEFCSGGGRGGSTNSVEDRGQRERGSGCGSGEGSCNLVQEISFHIVKFSYFLVL